MIQFLKRTSRASPRRENFLGCDTCLEGKSSQSPAASHFHRSSNTLDLVHSDLLGPISPPTQTGKNYILSFIDDYTRHNHVYLLSSKDQTPSCFAHYRALVKRQTGREIGKLKTDRGGEYSASEFPKFLLKSGIETKRGPAHWPQANLVAERFFRTLLGQTKTQLLQSGLPSFLWGKLAMYCSLQINCAPSKAINMKIPILEYQSLMVGNMHPFNFSQLHPLRCLAFAHIQNRAAKLEPTFKQVIFLGLECGSNAARLWDKTTSCVSVSRDVKYIEDNYPGTTPSSPPPWKSLCRL